MKKLVIPLLIIGIIASSRWFLPAQAQGGDCNLPPEDCAILEAHAAKMLDTSLLTVSDFTLSGGIDLPDPIEFSAQGSGQISLSQIGKNHLVLEITDPSVEEAFKIETKTALHERLTELGYVDATVELIDDQYIVDIVTADSPEDITSFLLPMEDIPLFEMVDFAGVPGMIGETACILTDAQIEQGLGDRLCEDGSQPIGTDGQPGGTPFHTIITSDMVKSAEPEFNQYTNGWGIFFTLDDTGTQIFADYTEANLNQRLAIVINGMVISAPLIQQKIANGSASISGSFTKDEAKTLASQMVGYTLPISLQLTSSEVMGPYNIIPAKSSFTVDAFNYGTKQAQQKETTEIAFSNGTLTINQYSDGYTAPIALEVGNDSLSQFLDKLANTNEGLIRDSDVELSGQMTAVFRNELPLVSVFEFEPAALLTAKLLTYMIYSEPDFTSRQMMIPIIEGLFVDVFKQQLVNETVVIYRYISTSDFTLKRFVVETEFELQIMLLESFVEGLEIGENLNDLTGFHLRLQADFE